MRIDIANLIRSMSSSELQRCSLEKDTLKVGDNLLGRVLEIKNSGKALIDFGRFRALARTQFPVREGAVIDVKVLEKGIPIRLGLNNPAQEISQQAKKMLSLIEFPSENILEKPQSETKKVLNRNNGIFKGRGGPIYVKDILARIAAHFGPINIGKNSSELSSQLKSYIENSGIFFEKKIENVIIKSFVKHDRLESAHALTYALPLEVSNQRAKLKIYYSKKNKGKSEEGFKVSLLLAMDKIGQIRTDFFLMDKDLNITFFVNECKIKEYVDDHSEEIVGSLRNHFKRLTLNVIISENEIEEFEIKDPGVVSAGIVDLRV